jgi:hypothetical protein
MLRKSLAVLLVLAWVILASLDVLEDLNVPHRIALSSCRATASPGLPSACTLVNNIVESAYTSSGRDPLFVSEPVVDASLLALTVFHVKLRLHQLHAIYLI